jgi:hypothetical protein
MSMAGAIHQVSGNMCLSPFLGCERLHAEVTHPESDIADTSTRHGWHAHGEAIGVETVHHALPAGQGVPPNPHDTIGRDRKRVADFLARALAGTKEGFNHETHRRHGRKLKGCRG